MREGQSLITVRTSSTSRSMTGGRSLSLRLSTIEEAGSSRSTKMGLPGLTSQSETSLRTRNSLRLREEAE